MVFSSISLSDDIYRYLYSGYLVKNGINPYQISPDSIDMQMIIDSFPYYNLINNPSVSDPYPPLMLFLTSVITFFINYNLIMWKMVITFSMIVSSLLIKKLLLVFNRNPNNIILWAWNPLVILEFSHSGHNDIFPIVFLLTGIYLILNDSFTPKRKLFLGGVLLGISISLKFFSIFIILFFLKKLRIQGIIGIIFGLLLNLIPLLFLGAYSTSGISIFLNYWRFNGGLFEITTKLISIIGLHDLMISDIYIIIRPIFFLLIVLTLIISSIIFYFDQNRENRDKSLIFSSNVVLIFLIFSPVVHPWYLLWGFPFVVLMPNIAMKKSYIGYTITIFLSYYFYSCNCEDILIIFLEYFPIYFLILLEVYYFLKKNNIIEENFQNTKFS